MKKTNLLIVSMVLFAAFFGASGVASGITLSDKYVGNTVVDLEWTKYGSTDFSCYKLYRDGARIHTESDRDTTFYRDSGPSKGVTYNYKIEVYNATGVLKQSDTESVTTGNVHGTITQDLSWAADQYKLTGDVRVESVTLEIKSLAIVTSPTAWHSIKCYNGNLVVSQAEFNNTCLYISNSHGSSIKKSYLYSSPQTKLIDEQFFELIVDIFCL